MKKALAGLTLFGAIVVVGVIVVFTFGLKEDRYAEMQTQQFIAEEIIQRADIRSAKEKCPAQFTEYLVDPGYVEKVGQVGVLHGSGDYLVERSYISVKKELSRQKIPLYAPADMVLTAGSRYRSPYASAAYLPDYALRFEAGCGLEITLGHVKEVVESIAAQMPDIKADSREDQLQPIRFRAGDLLGYYIQEPGGVAGFDFVVRDRNVTAQFMNQARYENGRASNLIHGVCPYDFYTGEKKRAYYDLLGGGGGTLFTQKDCGTVSRDMRGTISGMWFLDKDIRGSIYDSYIDGGYASPITIVGDEERISIGNAGPDGVVHVYKNNPTYALPTDVRDEHCYQAYITPTMPRGFVFFKYIDEGTIEVYDSGTGICPKGFPDGKGRRYYK